MITSLVLLLYKVSHFCIYSSLHLKSKPRTLNTLHFPSKASMLSVQWFKPLIEAFP